MEINILVVDDDEKQANDIARKIACFTSAINSILNISVTYFVEIISGTDAFDRAYSILQQEHNFHIVFSDEQLHDQSGFALLKSIDAEKYSTYKVLFSKYDMVSSKTNENTNVKWVFSKRIVHVFQVLLLFEKEVLLEKLYGNVTYFDTVYTVENSTSKLTYSLLQNIYEKFDEVSEILSPKKYIDIKPEKQIVESYKSKLRNIEPILIVVKTMYNNHFISKEYDAITDIEKKKLFKLPLYQFVLVSTICIRKNEFQSLYCIQNNGISFYEIYRINSTINKSLIKFKGISFIISHSSYSYNLLWVYPLVNKECYLEIINQTNKRQYVEVPYFSFINKAISTLKGYFKK